MISIRHAREEETDLLADIGLRAWENAMLPIGETASMLENARAAFVNFTRSTWLTITVVERHGVPAGWAAREALDENITDFWIDPAYERQGLGTALLAAVEATVERQGFDRICLQTHARNQAAVKFFEARGYSVHWLSVTYAPKLDRDVESVGLVKYFAAEAPDTYGPGF